MITLLFTKLKKHKMYALCHVPVFCFMHGAHNLKLGSDLMSVKVNVKMNHAALGRLINAQKQALEMTTEAIKSDVIDSATVPWACCG